VVIDLFPRPRAIGAKAAAVWATVGGQRIRMAGRKTCSTSSPRCRLDSCSANHRGGGNCPREALFYDPEWYVNPSVDATRAAVEACFGMDERA